MSVKKKWKAAGSKPKKMACGGRVKMQAGGKVEKGIRKVVQNDGSVIYVNEQGQRVSGPGSAPASTKGLAAHARRQRGEAPPAKKKTKTSGPKGFVPVAKGVGDVEYARKMREKRRNKKRGIKFIK